MTDPRTQMPLPQGNVPGPELFGTNPVVTVSATRSIEVYRDALLLKQRQLSTGPMSKPFREVMEGNHSRKGDLVDQASGINEVHIQFKLKETDAKILRAVIDALRRIEDGTYGVCHDCGEEIAKARLDAIPWARTCITCKENRG